MHYNFHIYKLWMVYCSFAVAIIVQGVFFSLKLSWYFQPSWIMMILIYWTVILPKKVNIGTGFTLGFITDCIFGSIIGIHSLSLSLLSYLTIRKVYVFKNISIWQQSFFILFLSMIYQIIKILSKFLITKIFCSPEIFWNCILDGLTWPFLLFVMNRIYRF